MTSACYTPQGFTPDNKPLLNKAQWQQVQMYLKNCAGLPLKVGDDPSKGEFPFADSVAVYNTMHDAGAVFQTGALVDAKSMANTLFDYGTTSKESFAAVSNLMNQGSGDKTVLKQIFGSLKEKTAGYQLAAKSIFDGTKTFADVIGASGTDLTNITKKYVDQAGGLKTDIENIKLDITAQHTVITTAQAKILSDQKVIDNTVYYSWIPLIGTIVALAEIITHSNDIEEQIKKIKAAISALQVDNTKLAKDQAEMSQLIYAETFNNNQIQLIGEVMPSLQKIEGAWGTIGTELGDILTNIEAAEKTSDVPCLADIKLSTAVSEWNQVANDAHDFMLNFYVQADTTAKAA